MHGSYLAISAAPCVMPERRDCRSPGFARAAASFGAWLRINHGITILILTRKLLVPTNSDKDKLRGAKCASYSPTCCWRSALPTMLCGLLSAG